MAGFCLHPDEVTKFKRALVDRTLDPLKLADMTSDERRAAFTDVVGKDNAEAVNRLFESKLLLKNTQQGMITWAKTVSGMKPEIKRDLISRIERLDERVLSPEEEQIFYKDLVKQKLGVPDVSLEEVKKVNELTNAVKQARAKLTDADGNPINRREDKVHAKATPEETAFGKAQNDLEGYVESLKLAEGDPDALGWLKKTLVGGYNLPMKILTVGHGGVIPFTHGRNSIFVPGEGKIFVKAAARAYSYFRKEGGTIRHAKDMADLRADPLYDFAVKSGLPIKVGTQPVGMGMNRWTTASFDALKPMRLELFKKYWRETPSELKTPEYAKVIAHNIAHSTGDVNVPPGVAKVTRPTMFAPKLRFAKYASAFVDPLTSKFGAKRFAKLVGVNIALLAVNDMVNRYFFNKTGDDTVNWTDPTKADWLRMKINGMVIPMAPTFEAARLPFRLGAVALDPKEKNKWKVAGTEIAGAAHPAITAGYDILTGQDMWSGKGLPFRGVSQLLYGDKRDPDKAMSGKEYASDFTPIWMQPVLKEFAVNGIHIDNEIAPKVIEAMASGLFGEHVYEAHPTKKTDAEKLIGEYYKEKFPGGFPEPSDPAKAALKKKLIKDLREGERD